MTARQSVPQHLVTATTAAQNELIILQFFSSLSWLAPDGWEGRRTSRRLPLPRQWVGANNGFVHLHRQCIAETVHFSSPCCGCRRVCLHGRCRAGRGRCHSAGAPSFLFCRSTVAQMTLEDVLFKPEQQDRNVLSFMSHASACWSAIRTRCCLVHLEAGTAEGIQLFNS